MARPSNIGLHSRIPDCKVGADFRLLGTSFNDHQKRLEIPGVQCVIFQHVQNRRLRLLLRCVFPFGLTGAASSFSCPADRSLSSRSSNEMIEKFK